MYLLSGESLTKAEWFRPERQPLNLEGQKSTSSLTIGPEAPEIPIGAWMLDDEDPGAGIVWRVKTVDTQYDTKTRTVQLEHIVNTLKDISIFGEIAPKDITGNAGSTTCTARQAFEFILARHDRWQLGTMAGEFENISNPYSFNGEDLLSAMETITSSLEDAYWDFDLTSLPFRVNILKLGEDVGCEMRMSRNITTLRKTVDRSRMYTRIYPIGENDIHIDGDYISQNVDSYGLVVKIETDSSKKTKAELLQWAQERLARHCEPSVTITISGIELSEATGEPLDHFREHTKCRVPLPEFGTTITEKVTKLSWRDKIHEKKNVTITLANQREDIASIVNRINKKNAAGARAKAKKDKEDHAWFVDTEDHVGMVAEAIIGQGPDGVDWSRVSSLITDGEGIHGRVTRAEGYLVTMQSSLDMNEESLRIAFENMGSLRSEFAISAESMRIAFQNDLNCTRMEFQASSESLRIAFENDLNCTRMEFQASSESLRIAFENDVTSLRTQVTTQAGLFDVLVEGTGSNARIKPARIQASINAATGTSKIQLSADNVVIDGDLITGALEGEDVVCDSVETGGLVVGGTCTFDINAPIVGGDGGTDEYNWGDVIVNAELLTDNKTLRLTRLDGSTLDFSKATTLSPSWSSGAFPLTVNATQINNGVTTNVGAKTIGFTNAADVYLTVEKNGDPTAFGNSRKLINVPFKIVHHAGGQVGDQNRYSSSLASVDASSVYDNGWNDVVLSDPDWQYPAADHNSDNTTAANSVVVAASAKSDGTLRQKAIPIALTVDTANKKAKVTAGGYVRAIANIDMKTNAEYNTAVANAGYAGRAAVTISSTLSWGTTPASDISVSQNSLTVSTAGRTDNSGTIEQDTETFNLYTQANVSYPTATFYVTHTDSTDGNRILKKEVTCSAPYSVTDGSVVPINFGNPPTGWTKHEFTAGGSKYQYHTKDGTSGSSTNVLVYFIPRLTVDGSVLNPGTTIYRSNSTIPTQIWHDAYSAGQTAGSNAGSAGVTLNDPTWNALNGATIPSSRTVTVSTSGRKNTSGATANLEKTVTVDVSVDSSKAYIKHSGTTVAEVAHSYKYTQAEYETALATVPSGYEAISSVTIAPSSDVSLYPGGSQTVAAKKDGNTVSSITVTAKSIRKITLDSAGNHNGSWYNYIVYFNDDTSMEGYTDGSSVGLYLGSTTPSGGGEQTLTWTVDGFTASSSDPGNPWVRIGSVNKNYEWVRFKVTVNGEVHYYKIHILQS